MQPLQAQPTPYNTSLYSYAPLFAVPPTQLYEAQPSRPLPIPATQPPSAALPPINDHQASQQSEAAPSARSNPAEGASATSLPATRVGGCCDECRAVIQGDQARDMEGNALDAHLLDELRELCVDDPVLSNIAYSSPFAYFNRRVFKGYRIKWSFRQSLPVVIFDGPNEPQRTSRAVFSIGDGTARLHPWMRGALMPPSNEPEMRMLVMGENEPSFAFILLCTEQMFATIKAEQNLHVSFPAFTKRVVDLLTTVGKESPDTLDSESIVNENESRFLVSLKLNEGQGVLSIVETTAFRSLTHVSLTLQRLTCCQLRILLASEIVLRQRYSKVLEVHAASLLREAEEQRGNVDVLQSRLEAQKDEHRSQKLSLEQETDEKINETIRKCEAIKEAARKGQLETELQLKEADKERMELRRSVAEMQRHLISQGEWEAQKNELTETIAKLSAERDTLLIVAKKEEEVSRKLLEVLDEKAELKERLLKYERDEKTVEGTLSTLEERTRHLNAWKIKAKEAQTKLGDTETRLAELQEQFDAAKTTLNEAKIALETRHEQVRKLEKDLVDANDVVLATRADNQRLHNANMELNKRLTDSLVQMAKREQPDQFNSWAATGTGDAITSMEPEDALFPDFAPASTVGRQRPAPRMMNSAPLAPSQHGPVIPPKAAATVGLIGAVPGASSQPSPPPLGVPPPATTPTGPAPPTNPGIPSSYNDFLTHVPPPTPGLNLTIARPRGVTTSPVPGLSRTSLPPTRPPASISVTPPPSRQSQPVVGGRGSTLAAPKANVRKRPPGAANAFTIAQRGRTPQG